jgi:hypothetical protein
LLAGPGSITAVNISYQANGLTTWFNDSYESVRSDRCCDSYSIHNTGSRRNLLQFYAIE